MMISPLAVRLVGWIGVSIVFFAYLFQLIRLLRIANARGISVSTFFLPFVGCIFWIFYGSITNDAVLTFSNIAFAAVILWLFFLTSVNQPFTEKNRIAISAIMGFALGAATIIAILDFALPAVGKVFANGADWLLYVLSILGGLLISIKLVPQSWNTYRTKYARSLSAIFLTCLIVGNIMRFTYSLMSYINTGNFANTLAPMIFFAFAATMSSVLLFFKIIYDVARRSGSIVKEELKSMNEEVVL